MKKGIFRVVCLFFALVCAVAAADVKIDASTFPDAAFRSYVSENIDSNHDGQLSDSEIHNTTLIYADRRKMTSLKGIELFTNLEQLYCHDNLLTKLDLSRNTKLVIVNCSNNQLKSLNLKKLTNLYVLFCNENKLTNLDVSDCQFLVEMFQEVTPATHFRYGYGWWYTQPGDSWPDSEKPCLFVDENVRVTPSVEKPATITLNKTKATIKKGKTLKLTVKKIEPENAKITWKSSDKKIAAVDKNGKVKAKKKGKCTITCTTSAGVQATCKITVK